ncbi:MAG: hypothetical protein IPG61_00945 [bacterium]|nr:hypothetical protein [bacterium]
MRSRNRVSLAAETSAPREGLEQQNQQVLMLTTFGVHRWHRFPSPANGR